MKNILLLLSFFGLGYNFYAQQVTINIKGNNSDKAALFSLQGENTFLIDSIKSNNAGIFSYFFDKGKRRPGIYRLTINKNIWLDFIYDGEEINIETFAGNILDSIKVKLSESNKLFYSFIKLNKVVKTKAELLNIILTRYPKDDDYYQITSDKLSQILNNYHSFIKEVSKERPGSFISRYVNTTQLSIASLDFNLTHDEQLLYLKSHALDNMDFNDAGLTYSDAFTNKTIEYLTYYRNPQLTKEHLEKEFMKAVDTILNKAKVHQLVYQHIVEYLIDGFKKFGFDYVIDYIVENYVIKDDLCLDVKTEGLIKKRIDQAKHLHIGNVVPNIILPDLSGRMVELNKINADKMLIIFYASWCPHCKKLLPEIGMRYTKNAVKGFQVFAVSVDTSKEDWSRFIKENKLDWINVSDLKGWDTKAASDYYLYATPTMFLIDKEKRIIGKPLTMEELEKIL